MKIKSICHPPSGSVSGPGRCNPRGERGIAQCAGRAGTKMQGPHGTRCLGSTSVLLARLSVRLLTELLSWLLPRPPTLPQLLFYTWTTHFITCISPQTMSQVVVAAVCFFPSSFLSSHIHTNLRDLFSLLKVPKPRKGEDTGLERA